MHILNMIRYWARTDPNRLAIIQPELMTSYAALDDAIEAISARIDKMGFKPQEPVGVAISNPAIFVAAVFGLMRSGQTPALIHQNMLPFLEPAGIRNLIYDRQGQMLGGGKNIRFDTTWLPNPTDKRPTYRNSVVRGGDLIYFTSGTTGLPKKIVQKAGALQELLSYPYTCASGASRSILVMPGLSSTFGFNRVCEILNAGKTACFAPDANAALALITQFGIEVIVASAAQAISLVNARKAAPGYRVDSVETMFVGGGQVSAGLIANIRALLCRNVINQYGSTETGVVALTPFDIVGDIPGGIPLPWVEVKVTDESGNEVPVGTEGLIGFRTPQLTANLVGSDCPPNVKDGWFLPGDIGMLTANGVLKILGRSSDVINRGGQKVSGARIEHTLASLPFVKEVAACGVSGRSGLEELWIAIIPNGPVDFEDVKAVLRDHQDIRIEPDEIFVVDELPRGELGKVQKIRLREMLLKRKSAN